MKKTINKSIDINAPAQNVWKALTDKASYAVWAAGFSEGGGAEVVTDWQEGSRVVFKGADGAGLFGTIAEIRPNEFIKFVYGGMTGADGADDLEGADSLSVKGWVETYSLTEKDGMTHLEIASDMSEEYFDQMSASWDEALPKIKGLAEGSIEAGESAA